MKKILIVIFLITVSYSCSHWRMSSLKSKRFALIENGNQAGNVKINTDEYALNDLTFGLDIFNGMICTVDNILKRIQIMSSDNEIEVVIGSIKDINAKKVKAVNFNFSIIGSFTMDDDDNIYVQNRIPQSGNARRYNNGEGVNFPPSYILVFNKDGNLQYTLGQSGTPDIPFYYIENLEVDSDGRLIVISRSFDSWSIFRFTGKKRDFYVNLGKIDFTEKEGDEVFNGKIENIRVYQNEDKLLLSVSYYHGMRLKYRKVFNYSIENQKIEKAIVNIPDPKNVLFNLVDDKKIYFWNMNGVEVKFMICNMDGSIIDNKLLEFDDSKNYYSNIISNESGKIYSYHVTKKGIEIFKWE